MRGAAVSAYVQRLELKTYASADTAGAPEVRAPPAARAVLLPPLPAALALVP